MNGCGKTTLLRLLAGFEIPTDGLITIDGEDMQSIQPYNRPVNMMFQSYALFPHMNVAKNIALFVIIFGVFKPVLNELNGCGKYSREYSIDGGSDVFQAMVGNSMPVSPESVQGKPPGSPYYSYSKRPIEDSHRGKIRCIL